MKKKSDILLDANYRYYFDRAMYVNRHAKKAFSVEYVDDHAEEQLRQRIQENTGGAKWKFYFNSPPSDGVQHELERELEKVHA
ncbi:MAG TPA: hypothetical protein VE291_05850 [Terracidiphilus sp.]|nr:hypothetical protein [Terracidiphilus sp.]